MTLAVTLVLAGLLLSQIAVSPAVEIPPTPADGASGPAWIETQPGNLPIVLSAPHGGSLEPQGIPDRQQAVLLQDQHSLEFTQDLAQALQDLTGRRPFLVLNNLSRSKLDPNRSLGLGAQGDPAAAAAWQAYHADIESAEASIVAQCGWGLYFDIHSNGLAGTTLQFGYGLDQAALALDDSELNDPKWPSRTNLRGLATWSRLDLPDLVRGPDSLGGLMQAHYYRAEPGPSHPVPVGQYFDGGYSVATHGSQHGGAVDAIQIELPYSLLTDAFRPRLARNLAASIVAFMDWAYGFDLAGSGPPCSGFADVRIDEAAGPAIAAVQATGGLPACGSLPRRLCPRSTVTRAQAAQSVWRILQSGGVRRINGTAPLSDVAAEGEGAAIQTLWGAGLLDVCGAQPLRFCPSDPETRASASELALKLMRGPAYLPPPPSGRFVDAPAGRWTSWWTDAAASAGLLLPCHGVGSPWICPQAAISRADFAVLLAGALDLVSPYPPP